MLGATSLSSHLTSCAKKLCRKLLNCHNLMKNCTRFIIQFPINSLVQEFCEYFTEGLCVHFRLEAKTQEKNFPVKKNTSLPHLSSQLLPITEMSGYLRVPYPSGMLEFPHASDRKLALMAETQGVFSVCISLKR